MKLCYKDNVRNIWLNVSRKFISFITDKPNIPSSQLNTSRASFASVKAATTSAYPWFSMGTDGKRVSTMDLSPDKISSYTYT